MKVQVEPEMLEMTLQTWAGLRFQQKVGLQQGVEEGVLQVLRLLGKGWMEFELQALERLEERSETSQEEAG